MSPVVVHVVEISLSIEDDWSVCDVFAHPVETGTVAGAVADLTNAVRDHIESHGDVCSVTTSRTLDGVLRSTRIEQEHGGAESYFRHNIREALTCDAWLSKKHNEMEEA